MHRQNHGRFRLRSRCRVSHAHPAARHYSQSSGPVRIGAQDRRFYKEAHREIDWKAIAGMRNVLVHDYFDVDFEAVGDVVTRDIPPLESAMRSVLARLDHDG